jgi:hypothetical protein
MTNVNILLFGFILFGGGAVECSPVTTYRDVLSCSTFDGFSTNVVVLAENPRAFAHLASVVEEVPDCVRNPTCGRNP